MKKPVILLLALLLLAVQSGCGREPEPAKPQARPAQTQAQAPNQPQSSLIDINRAGAEELMTLKGIGEARAKAIIRGRPYSRKDDLVHKGIISESVYGHIKDQIIARQK